MKLPHIKQNEGVWEYIYYVGHHSANIYAQ